MVSDAWSITLLSLATLALTTLWLLTRKRTRPPLPPGPSGLPVVGNLLSLEPELHSYFTSLARVHGPIFSLRLGSKFAVVVNSPALAKEVLRDHDANFANHDVPAVARISSYGGHDVVWSPLGPEWRLLRKVCVREMLGAATIDAMYELRRRELRRTIGYLFGRAGSPVYVGEQAFLTSMNVLTSMLWGGAVEELEEGERECLGREFRKATTEMTRLFGQPNLSDFYPCLARFDLQGLEKKMRTVVEKFDGIFERVIDHRLRMDDNGERTEKDFVQVLLKMVKDGYEEGGGDGASKVTLSMIHLKALLMDMLVGGTDTSSNTIEFAIAELMNKPELLKKVQGELDAVVGKDNIVEEHHLQKLPYLHALMKETLRLHPVVPLLVPHRPCESSIIGGYTVPKDSRVFINVWAIHRDPMIWDDPLVYDPDRFMDAKFDFNGNNFNYFPFGSGRRICAGIPMAERMVLYTLASLLHSFDWELPEGERLDLEEKFGVTLSKRIPLVLVPKPRLCDPALYQ